MKTPSGPLPGDEPRLVLAARNLVVGYQGRALLPPIDLAIHRGETWVVVGRNGSGKSTFLKTMLGLLAPVSGTVERPAGVECSYVAQRHHVEPTVPMRGVDLVAMGRDQDWSFLNPFKTPDSYEDVMMALKRVGAEGFAKKRFDAMSGGQQQKVMLAQALVSRPEVIILDEPTAAMDVVAEHATIHVLSQLRQDLGTAVVLVTHRLSLGLRHADKACFVDAETGTLVVGTPRDVIAHPTFQKYFGLLVEHHDAEEEKPCD